MLIWFTGNIGQVLLFLVAIKVVILVNCNGYRVFKLKESTPEAKSKKRMGRLCCESDDDSVLLGLVAAIVIVMALFITSCADGSLSFLLIWSLNLFLLKIPLQPHLVLLAVLK
ncbi:hypothetical protein POM88_038873 [Heracleum sosnowskyi]|uniref:Uncharacterized protein n=1 Tax=Heracleum sosnowskyi TaxID=360622 RepID=A0AAD8HBW8_9APIA|nr:hypothetical protein POM88_038873 [Heracleum sosnowskyi]